MKRQRDSQRARVYRWSHALNGERTRYAAPLLTIEECTQLVNRVWNRYRSDSPPTIKNGRGCIAARSCFDMSIVLPRWARSKPIILHEVAHSLLEEAGRYTQAAHGPEFARLYADLLSRYGGIKIGDVTRLAREHGVRLGPAAACLKPLPKRR